MEVQPHLLNLSAYINQNLDKDLPLASLAKRVGLSPFHFHRKFGAYFGESLHQHIKRLRLERAAFALVNSSTPVRDIARESGYKTVSAFSHAFSGFTGESPTRYRSLGKVKRESDGASGQVGGPAWRGVLEPLEFAFVRAVGNGSGTQRSIREALDLFVARIGPVAPDESGDDESEMPVIVATGDFYRIVNGGEFRLDVGMEAARIPAERSDAVGIQTIPGGRYARFDFRCAPGEVIDRCLRAFTQDLKSAGDTAGLSQCFLRFARGAEGTRNDDAERDYAFFVPLDD